jgi:hypothetical protein
MSAYSRCWRWRASRSIHGFSRQGNSVAPAAKPGVTHHANVAVRKFAAVIIMRNQASKAPT